MGQHVARLLLLTTTLGGCSLIYSSNRLPEVLDAPPDAPPPAVCKDLKLERVFPTELIEGQGDDGGRSAVLIIQGSNICPGATVSIVPHAGETNTPLIALDMAKATVDDWGLRIAVPVKLSVDANISAAKSVRLDVRVSQSDEVGGTASSSLDKLEGDAPVLALKGLDELSGAAALPTDAPHLYSRVTITSLGATDRSKPLIVRSMASLAITGTGTYSFSATAAAPGPGGFTGGAGGAALSVGNDGKPGGGAGGGRPNGGGAGFAAMGGAGDGGSSPGPVAGEPSITTLEFPNRGSGGAGGQGSLLGAGGDGGHGGGSVELTAGGNMMVAGTIEANGSKGTTGGSGKTGGSGSGGVVLLRAGGTLSVGGVKAVGALSGGSGGGVGSVGRVRLDSPDRSLTITSDPAVGYRGPMFATATELIVREPQPRITLVGQPNALIKYTVEDGQGTTRGPVEISLSNTGESTVQLGVELFEGYNRLCALVTGVDVRRDEAESCITLAYLFRRP